VLEKIIRYEAVHRIAAGTICAGASMPPTAAATLSFIRPWSRALIFVEVP